LAQAKDPIVFVGDSITESAFLPASFCGHPVVNAGLGGATARTYLQFASSVLSTLKAALIVVAIGTNDAQNAARSIPFADVRLTMTGEKLTVDGVHLTPDGYRGWMTAVSAAVSKTLNCQAASN